MGLGHSCSALCNDPKSSLVSRGCRFYENKRKALGGGEMNRRKLNWAAGLRVWGPGICDWSPALVEDGG